MYGQRSNVRRGNAAWFRLILNATAHYVMIVGLDLLPARMDAKIAYCCVCFSNYVC